MLMFCHTFYSFPCLCEYIRVYELQVNLERHVKFHEQLEAVRDSEVFPFIS